MARLTRRILGWGLFLALIAAAYVYGRDYVRTHPQDVPWTDLRLGDPVGAFTGRKLLSLTGDPAQCRALLSEAGIAFTEAPVREAGENCGYSDGVRLGDGEAAFDPVSLVTSCAVAATSRVLVDQVIQPAARRQLGSDVVRIRHAGSYSCRRINGRPDAGFSEHATADAIDITGFDLEDGRSISLLEDWSGTGPESAFLREVHEGGCRLFATALSPDYNRAHADHFHFDQAERGKNGFRFCR